ncbi:MAG: M20/M25/M40 family metallo-hydrolase [Saprospiraceae bacterium]
MRKIILLIVLFKFNLLSAQSSGDQDAWMIKNIHSNSLKYGQAYEWLRSLTTQAPGRLAGSSAAAAAVELTHWIIDTLGFDRAYIQPCKVPHWVRGDKEIVRIVNSPFIGSKDLDALSLGNSTGSGPMGVTAEVVEVRSLDTLEKMGEIQLKGKIVFFNRPMDVTQLRTFAAYGGAVDQRGRGPAIAAKYGALGAIVRSMTTGLDDIPHTGATNFLPGEKNIPALAISTNSAELLSQELQKGSVRIYIRNTCKMLGEADSYNVIGEIKGSLFPNEIIAVGGHLDSWDVAQGAHDDGAGCVQSIEVLNQLKKLGYKPQRTLRCVLFMNEENGSGGSKAYSDSSNARKEKHILALESDSGGFTPRGLGFSGEKSVFENYFKKVNSWSSLLEPYDIKIFNGGGGADIAPLKSQNGLLVSLQPDSQRYFDYHHTRNDTFEAVNKRELLLGAAAMASLVYLVDKYGLQ